jgi:hypothetical protein
MVMAAVVVGYRRRELVVQCLFIPRLRCPGPREKELGATDRARAQAFRIFRHDSIMDATPPFQPPCLALTALHAACSHFATVTTIAFAEFPFHFHFRLINYRDSQRHVLL